jgi:hypothetical protein
MADSSATISVHRISQRTHMLCTVIILLFSRLFKPLSLKITLHIWNSATRSFKMISLFLVFFVSNKVMVTRDRITNHRNHPLVLENPNETNFTNFQHTFSINIWCRIIDSRLTGPFVFEHKFRDTQNSLKTACQSCWKVYLTTEVTRYDSLSGHTKNLIYETKSQMVAELPRCRSDMMVPCFIEKLVLF